MRGVVSTIIGFVFVWVFSLFATEIGGFRAILIIGAILYLVFASLALIFLPNNHTENNSSDKMETSSEKGSILAALKLPGVWLVGLFIFSCYSIVAAGINYLGTYTTQVLGVAVSVSSSIAIVRSYIIAILAGIITGIIADKFKYRTKFIIILLSIEIISVIAMIFLSQQVAFAIILSLIVATLYYMINQCIIQ
jgi:predicted MFS family arabinose efflux permease